jgi:hypothetical protein
MRFCTTLRTTCRYGVHDAALPLAVPEPDPASLDTALHHHVAVTTAILADVLVATTATLDEPRTASPELALHYLGYLVETLLGAAAGAVIGRVVTTAVRGAGRDVHAALADRLRAALRRIGPGRPLAGGALSERWSAFEHTASERPLVHELGVRLHERLADASRDHHAVLTQLAAALPADRRPGFAATLAALDADPMLGHLWTEHLGIAWRHYAAAVSNVRDAIPLIPPALATTASCATWRTWLSRVRGERVARPAVAPSSDYIMAVM